MHTPELSAAYACCLGALASLVIFGPQDRLLASLVIFGPHANDPHASGPNTSLSCSLLSTRQGSDLSWTEDYTRG